MSTGLLGSQPRALALLCFLVFYSTGATQLPLPHLPWSLVWNDEFTQPPLDLAKWCRSDWRSELWNRFDLNAFRTDPLNPPDNIEFHNVNNGSLCYVTQIVRSEHRFRNADDAMTPLYDPTTHTYEYSAPTYMSSSSKFKYGYFEIRCRLPNLQPGENNLGLGANFWMYKESPTTDRYPKSEIDIFEFQGKPNPHTQTCNIHHHETNTDVCCDNGQYDTPSPDFSMFHTFGAWWGPNFIKFYLDGVNFHGANADVQPVIDQMIPMQIFIDINVFLQGQEPNANTRIPYEYDIDYVRVYQLNSDQCDVDYVNCSPIPALSSIYRSITIGGGTCGIPNGSSKSLTAKNTITILPGFEAELGSELTMDIYTNCHTSQILPCQTCFDCD